MYLQEIFLTALDREIEMLNIGKLAIYSLQICTRLVNLLCSFSVEEKASTKQF